MGVSLVTKCNNIAEDLLSAKKAMQTALHNVGISVKPWSNNETVGSDWSTLTDPYMSWAQINSAIMLLRYYNEGTTSMFDYVTKNDDGTYTFNTEQLSTVATTDYEVEITSESPTDDKYKGIAEMIKAVKRNIATALKATLFERNPYGIKIYPLNSEDTTYETFASYAGKILPLKKSEAFTFDITIPASVNAQSQDWKRLVLCPCYNLFAGTAGNLRGKNIVAYVAGKLDAFPTETGSIDDSFTINWDATNILDGSHEYSFSSMADAYTNATYFVYPQCDEERTYRVTIEGNFVHPWFLNGGSANYIFCPTDDDGERLKDTDNTTLVWHLNRVVSNLVIQSWGYTGITSMASALTYTNVSAIPVVDAYNSFGLVTSFASFCSGCSKLTSLPYDATEGISLFDNAVLCTSYASAFYGCSNLSGVIPAGFFAGSPIATNFDSCFANTRINSVASGCWKGNTVVTNLGAVFYGVSTLTTIPDDLVEGCTALYDVHCMFMGTALAGTVSADLFKDCPITVAFRCFAGTKITTVESEFFNNTFDFSKGLLRLEGMFWGCSKLTSMPLDILSLCVTNECDVYASWFVGKTAITATIEDLPAITDWSHIKETRGFFFGVSGISGTSSIDVYSIGLIDTLERFFAFYYGTKVDARYELNGKGLPTNSRLGYAYTTGGVMRRDMEGVLGIIVHETEDKYIVAVNKPVNDALAWWENNSGTKIRENGYDVPEVDNASSMLLNEDWQNAEEVNTELWNSEDYIAHPGDYPKFQYAKNLAVDNLTWYVADHFNAWKCLNKYPFYNAILANMFVNITYYWLGSYGFGCCEELNAINNLHLLNMNHGLAHDGYNLYGSSKEKVNANAIIVNAGNANSLYITSVDKVNTEAVETLGVAGDWIDLGLPSGGLIESHNYGVTEATDAGEQYLSLPEAEGFGDKEFISDVTNTQNSIDIFQEIIDNCTIVKGSGDYITITGTNGNSVVIPFGTMVTAWRSNAYTDGTAPYLMTKYLLYGGVDTDGNYFSYNLEIYVTNDDSKTLKFVEINKTTWSSSSTRTDGYYRRVIPIGYIEPTVPSGYKLFATKLGSLLRTRNGKLLAVATES